MSDVWLKILGLFFLAVMASCSKEQDDVQPVEVLGYEVILVIGQSNTHQGMGADLMLDMPYGNIKQLGRFNDNNYNIIPAVEPLEHYAMLPNNIGFAMTFAKAYCNEFLATGRNVLIIPGGMGNTGFASHYWNPGDTLYNDAVARTNFVLEHYPCKLMAILWHQGENDIGYAAYQESLDSMIVRLRQDLSGDNDSVPFILGGMVPFWVDQDSARLTSNQIISNTVSRIGMTGYADPRLPYVITKPDNENIPNHFDAAGMREMGRRYFSEYKKLLQ